MSIDRRRVGPASVVSSLAFANKPGVAAFAPTVRWLFEASRHKYSPRGSV